MNVVNAGSTLSAIKPNMMILLEASAAHVVDPPRPDMVQAEFGTMVKLSGNSILNWYVV